MIDDTNIPLSSIGVAATAEDIGVMALIAGLLNPEADIAASSAMGKHAWDCP